VLFFLKKSIYFLNYYDNELDRHKEYFLFILFKRKKRRTFTWEVLRFLEKYTLYNFLMRHALMYNCVALLTYIKMNAPSQKQSAHLLLISKH